MIVVARFLSFLFHPVTLLLPTPFLVVYKQTYNSLYALKWEVFSFFFIFTGIALFLLGRFAGLFSDSDLSKREERYAFYKMLLFLAFLYFLLSVFFKGILFPMSIIALGMLLGIVGFELINRHTKASIHVGVASAFVVTLSLLFGSGALLATVWTIPLVSWSRLTLKRHTLSEIIVGGFFGVTITLLTFFIGKYVHS